MNKICVYTCITGNYDSLKEIKYKEKNIDYICFTNNKNFASNTWTIKYIDEDLDNLTLSRKVKILGFKYLNNYDLTIYIDGAIRILQPITKFLDECCDLKKYDMIGFKHQVRDCAYDEINICVYLNKETIENAKKMEKFLQKEKYPKHNGLNENTILIRKNNKDVNRLMCLWYSIVEKYSRRDQWSFNYCLWKNPIKIGYLDMHAFNNPYFKHDLHSNNTKIQHYKMYIGQYKDENDFDFHKCYNGMYTTDELNEGLKIKVPESTDVLDVSLDEKNKNIKSVSVYPKLKYELISIYDIDEYNFINNESKIRIFGPVKKGQEITIKINSEMLEKSKILEIAQDLNKKKNNLIIEKDTDIYNLRNDIEDLSNENKKLLDNNKELTNENKKLTEELHNIINSKSWKITKPLRATLKVIRKKK